MAGNGILSSKREQSSQIRNAGLRHESRAFRDLIFSGKRDLNRDEAIGLKSSRFELIRFVLETTPVQKIDLVGTPFPRTFKHFSRRIPTPLTDDLESELLWNAAILLRYSSRLRPLLELVRKTEASLLLGDTEAAHSLLEQINREFGYSLWWLKLKLLREEVATGIEGNRLLKNDLGDKAPNLILLFLHFFSQQSESTVSADDYEQAVDTFLSPDAISSKPVANYFQFRLGGRSSPDVSQLAGILSYEEPHSILDRYSLWCYCSRRFLGSGASSVTPDLTDAWLSVADSTHDSDACFLAAIIQPDRIRSTPVFSSVYQLMCDYTRGKYDLTFDAGLSLIASHPECFELYELVAKSALHSNIPLRHSLPDGAFSRLILESVYSVLRRRENTQDQLRFLKRAACRLHQSSIAQGILGFVRQHTSDELPLRLDQHTLLSGSVPTPRVFASIEPEDDVGTRFAQLALSFPDNAAVQLFNADLSALRGVSLSFPVVPKVRELRHRAYIEERRGCYELALDAYDQMTVLVTDSSIHLADVRAGRLRCLSKLGRVSECVRVLSSSCAQHPHLISGAMLAEVISKYETDVASTCAGDIGWPIVASTAQFLGAEPHDPDRLHDFLDDFLTAHRCIRPSDLLQRSSEFAIGELVALFRDVCTTLVLHSSIWYDTQEEVELERIKLCRWLSENDPSESSRYQQEIAELSRQAAIRDLVREADRSRIFVDTAGIERSLPELTRERAMRCVSLFLIRDDRLRKCLDIAGIDLDTLLAVNKVVFHDEGFNLFKSIFAELKDAFLGSTQYGLDANLSQRIRHGTLAGEIRAQFEEHHLVTHLGKEGQYADPVYWTSRLSGIDEDGWRCVKEACSRLSRMVDDTISEVRNEWIQLRSDKGPAHALFDYEFPLDYLYEVYAAMPLDTADEGAALEELIFEKIFEALWQRTEHNLTSVRDAIQTRLRDRLFGALAQFEQTLTDSLGHDATVNIRTAIANCRTGVGVGLENIAEWFRSGTKQRIPDCQFTHLADALLGVVSQYCGPSQIQCVPEVESVLTVPGHAFRGMWDILFILLDNAAKHSGGMSTKVAFSVTKREDVLVLVVKNEVDSSISLAELRSRADAIAVNQAVADDFSATRREGGSGHTKLHKILRYDLGCSQYTIQPSVEPPCTFSVTVTMKPEWSNDTHSAC